MGGGNAASRHGIACTTNDLFLNATLLSTWRPGLGHSFLLALTRPIQRTRCTSYCPWQLYRLSRLHEEKRERARCNNYEDLEKVLCRYGTERVCTFGEFPGNPTIFAMSDVQTGTSYRVMVLHLVT